MNHSKSGFHLVCALALCLAFFAATAPAAMDVDKVPNPLATAHLWVGDNSGVLGAEYIGLIQNLCETLKVKTDAEFAVITVDDLGGLTVEDFAARLFQRFGIGVAGKENGLLLLFSRDDRKVRFEVGYGLEGTITDSIAGRLLDEEALPFFREGEYGRGLYAAAKAAAGIIGEAEGTPLELTDPAVWPAQVTPPPSPAGAGRTSGKSILSSALISGGAVVLFVFLGYLFTLVRVARKPGRAAKLKAAGGGGVFGLTWLGSLGGLATLAAIHKTLLPYILSLFAVPLASSIGLGKGLLSLRRRIANHREPCPKCGQPMDVLDEEADDAFLTSEEIAEEKAGGMNYEIWQCNACGSSQSFAVKLGKATACPKCKRRTLVTTTTTLVAATRMSGGKVRITADCQNPACDYLKVTERHTPRLPPPSSGSSGHGSSGRSSFGGGRSGGGGASRGW